MWQGDLQETQAFNASPLRHNINETYKRADDESTDDDQLMNNFAKARIGLDGILTLLYKQLLIYLLLIQAINISAFSRL